MACTGHDCDFSTNRTQAHLLAHVREGITTHLTLADMALMPKRVDFQKPDLIRRVDAQIGAGREVWFHAHAVFDSNERREDIDADDCPYRYHLNITGVFADGSRGVIVIPDAPVIIGVERPETLTQSAFESLMLAKINENRINSIGRKYVKLLRPKPFGSESDWLMIEFPQLRDRDDFIKVMTRFNHLRTTSGLVRIATCDDDTGTTYFNLLARRYGFNTANWNKISGYSKFGNPSPNTKWTLSCPIRNIVPVTEADLAAVAAAKDDYADAIAKGRIMQASWDIETHRTIQSGLPPTEDDDDYTIFCVCTSYGWHSDMATLLRVGFSNVPCRARPEYGVIVFVCNNEQEVLQGWIDVHARMNPDLLMAFNGGQFDWPVTRRKMRDYGQLGRLDRALSCDRRKPAAEIDVMKWRFAKQSVKIDAENMHDLKCVANFSGLIDVDVLPTMLRMWPRTEVPKLASLNFFLSKLKLESKEDMPYKRMFRIYERAKRMRGVTGCHCRITTSVECCNSVDMHQHQPPCDCDRNIRELDYIPKTDPSPNDDDPYTDDLHPEIDGRCCYCTKYQRNLDDMGDVVYYCAIDCVRPHELCVKGLVVQDKRELSTLSYVPLFASFYRADGMKVRNLMGHYAYKFGLAFTNARMEVHDEQKDHYPGAWVCVPERGLNQDDPVAGMDYSSLYPSLIMTYNLSPDMVVYTQEQADELTAKGYVLHEIGPFNYERGREKGLSNNVKLVGHGWVVRHCGILEPGDQDTITSYNRMTTWTWTDADGPHTVTASHADSEPPRPGTSNPTTRPAGVPSTAKADHRYVPVYGRKRLAGERMGLFPYILRRLFEMRKPVKAKWIHHKDLLDKMDKAKTKSITVGAEVLQYDDVEFVFNQVEAKQKAIKVLANTFYGESGNFKSPIFELLVAAGTTTAGVANITRVRHMVQRLGCHVHYGDTDSLYISPPRRMFRAYRDEYESEMAQIAAKYAGVAADPRPKPDTPEAAYKRERIAARIRNWERKVTDTMRYMNELKNEIALFLMINNGTLFLMMAYEEVGLPTLFLGMKKYIMCPHMETINFYPDADKYLTRGLDYTKQGQTPIAIRLNKAMVTDIMIPDNELRPMDIVSEVVREYRFDNIDVEDLVLKRKYKPEKKNIPVLSFIDRMRIMAERYRDDPQYAAIYKLPDPGDKFAYIMAKKENRWDMRGRRLELKNGDRMEFYKVFTALRDRGEMEIDIDWYVVNAFLGVFARYIAYEDRFQPADAKYDMTNRDDYRKVDKISVTAAGKYLEEVYNARIGYDKAKITQTGRDYRAVYTRIAKTVREKTRNVVGRAADLYAEISSVELDMSLGRKLIEMAKDAAVRCDWRPAGHTIAQALMEDLSAWKAWTHYVSPRSPTVYAEKMQMLTARISETEKMILTLSPRITKSARDMDQIIGEYVNAVRIHGDTTIDDRSAETIVDAADLEAIAQMHRLYERLCSLEMVRLTTVETITAVMAERGGNMVRPGYQAAARTDSRIGAKAVIPDYEWA